MRDRRIWLVAVLVAGALVLSACGGGGDGGGDEGGGDGGNGGDGGSGGTTLSVTATEFAFDPGTLSAPAGEEVTVELTNGGTVEHDFSLDEAGLHVKAPATESASGSFELAAGTYTFYCSVPGHREAGMEGTLTVS